MDPEETIRSTAENLEDKVSIKNIFGEPITKHGRTIIPVAKIMNCFGGRLGPNTSSKTEDTSEKGNCGCGCVKATPAGMIEITEDDLRYIDFDATKKFAMVLGAGICLGVMMSKKKFKKYKHMHKWSKEMNQGNKEQKGKQG